MSRHAESNQQGQTIPHRPNAAWSNECSRGGSGACDGFVVGNDDIPGQTSTGGFALCACPCHTDHAGPFATASTHEAMEAAHARFWSTSKHRITPAHKA